MTEKINFFRYIAISLLLAGNLQAQDTILLTTPDTTSAEPFVPKVYNTKPIINIPIIAGGFVANYFGIKKLKSKPGLDSITAISLSPEMIAAINRDAAVQRPEIAEDAMKASDVALYACIVSPLALLLDDDIGKKEALQIGVIYLTTEAIMSNAYSWGVGHINKMRPYVYNPHESIARRTRMGSFNSFYGGHTAAAASCSFFLVKVYTDYNPDTKRKGLLYAGAVVPPAIVAYFRHKAGMHFPTDNLVGMAAGALIGVAVPHLHKRRDKNKAVSLEPYLGEHAGFKLKWQIGKQQASN